MAQKRAKLTMKRIPIDPPGDTSALKSSPQRCEDDDCNAKKAIRATTTPNPTEGNPLANPNVKKKTGMTDNTAATPTMTPPTPIRPSMNIVAAVASPPSHSRILSVGGGCVGGGTSSK